MADDDYSFLASLSAHPGRSGDTSNFNPTFAGNLAAALREARAAGLNVGLNSAYRTPGQTGSSFDASGRSLHSYGLAADIGGLGGPNSQAAQQWAAIAARHNLYNPYGIGSRTEFNHWQALPYELAAGSPQLAALQKAAQSGDWGNVVTAGNSLLGAPATTTSLAYAPTPSPRPAVAAINAAAGPGTRINAPTTPVQGALAAQPGGFYNSLVQIESSGRNIPSQVDKDYPGQPGSKSQGYAQIDTPTWRQFGAAAGIDLNQFPNAMSAPAAVQAQVAALIPLGRFGPNTIAKLTRQYGPLDKTMTIGQLDQKFGGAQMALQQAQPDQPYGPMDPSAQAHGSVVNPPIPADGAALAPAPADQPWWQTAFGKLTSAPTDKQGQPTGEKAPIDQITNALSGKTATGQTAQQEAPQRPIISPPGAHSAMMNPMAYAQMLATLQQPLTWGSRPLQGSGLPAGGFQGSAATTPPGMTLNSFLPPSSSIGYGIPAVGYGYG